MTTILNQLRGKSVNLVLNSGMPVPGIVGATDEQQDTVEITAQVQVPKEESELAIPTDRLLPAKVLDVLVYVRISSIAMIQQRM